MTYSVLIKGGSVLRSQKFERLDVAIEKDRIVGVGDFSGEKAEVEIDAKGKYISSGFIDLTNHSDTHWTIFSQPRQESLLAQGITTILGGNCGVSLAPLVKPSDIEGIQKWTDVSKINTNWHSVKEFLDELSRHSIGVNFATLVGHGTLRRPILGEEIRNLTKEELEEIKLILRRAMEDGAFGISTSLSAAHAKSYSIQELSDLFKIIVEFNGLVKNHLKEEGRNIIPSILEAISLGKETGVRTQFSHFKILGKTSWNILPEAIAQIDSARKEGLDLTLDFFPYTRTGSLLYMLLPSWAVEGGKGKILSLLRDPKSRSEILDYLKSLTLHYDKIVIASTLKDSTSIGKTIGELAHSSGLDPEEIIAELLEINELHVSIFNEVISPEHLEELITKEYAMVSSDGVGYHLKFDMPFDLPHPRSFGTYSSAMKLFVKDKKKISWEKIMYKFSELPASILGLQDRGRIEKDFFADIVVVDPEKVQSVPDYTSSHHEVEGIDWVIVNGKIAVRNGIISGESSGRVLRKSK